MSAKRRSRKKKTSKGKRIFSLIIIFLLLMVAAVVVAFYSWKKDIEQFNTEYAHEIQTSMGEVSYSVMGEGPLILLIHGEGTGLTDIFKFKDIAAAGYKIICPSRPGYPGTSIELGKSPEEQAEVLLSFLKAMNINTPVIIITESLGGPVALTFGRRFPSRVKALITLDALASPLKYDLDFQFNSPISITGNDNPGLFNNFLSYYYAKLRSAFIFQKIMESQTTYTANECKEYAVNIMVHDNEKDKFYTFLKTSMPSGIRTAGLENDIIVARGFKPHHLTLISAPAYIFQTENSLLIPMLNGSNISKPILNSNLYTYKGNGSMFWFGRNWENIKTRMLSFIKLSTSASKKETGVFSTWISMDDGTMLTLNNDGKFLVEFPSVEETKTWKGHFTINDDRILFYFTGNNALCKTQMGEYAMRFPEGKLILLEKNDKCKSRKAKMAGTWFRL